jgi:thiamine biosynthesis lipoprotein
VSATGVDSVERESVSPAVRRWRAIGTTVSVLTTDPELIDLAADLLFTDLAVLDFVCSRFRADSELEAVHQTGGELTQISPLLTELVETALKVAQITNGLVDPTVGLAVAELGYDRDFGEISPDGPPLKTAAGPAPGWQCVELDVKKKTLRLPPSVRLDLGSSAKAYAADQAAARISETIETSVLVNLGGDIAVAGPPPAGGWRIGIDEDSATAPEATTTVVAVGCGGLASSSPTVRRWRQGGKVLHHIVDPRSGEPANTPWRLVTVAAKSCTFANAASTAAIVEGYAAITRLEALGLPARLVHRDGSVVTTGGWPAEQPAAVDCAV